MVLFFLMVFLMNEIKRSLSHKYCLWASFGYGIATIQHIRRAIHVFRFFMGTGIMLRYLSVVPTLGFEITRRCGNEQLTENGKISIIT